MASARPHRRGRLANLLLAACVSALAHAPDAGAATPGVCEHEPLPPGGALAMTCVPAEGWNGELVAYAHGYVAPGEELGFHHLNLPGGLELSDVVQRAGYAFAATSYRRNGLVVAEGVQDLRELRAVFVERAGRPSRVHAVGVSEGGLIAALWAERHPEDLDGVLSLCAPLGGLQRQVDHVGDFRVLFDHYFPRVLPGSPARVPTRVRAHWVRKYRPRIEAAVRRHPRAAVELMRVARVGFPSRSPDALARVAGELLWYSAFATNDAARRLGGNPYGNVGRRYRGSRNDRALNRRVRRLRAAPAAVRAMRALRPTGALAVPMVTVHTSIDWIVPIAHQRVHASRVRARGASDLLQRWAVERGGHCEFRADELLQAFGALVASSAE